MDHSNDINNNIASAYLKMRRGEVEEVDEHHEKDADGNTIPHDDEINEDNTNDKSDDGDGMDKVQPKALKKKFKNRKDQDIDNDGDKDDSDEYLHNRRKTVSKAIDTDDESDEPVAKTDRRKKLDKKDSDADMEAEGYGRKKMKEAMEKGMPPGEHVFGKKVDGKEIMVHKLDKSGKFCAYVDGKKIGEYDDLKSAKSAAMDSMKEDADLDEAIEKEGNMFTKALMAARKNGDTKFIVGTKSYNTEDYAEEARPGTKAQQRAFDKADKTAKSKDKVSLKPMPTSMARKMKEAKKPSYLMKRIQEKANHSPQDETRDSFDKQIAGRRLTKTFNNELEGQMTEQEFVAMHDPKNAEVPEFANAPVVHAKTFKSFKDSVKAGPKRSGDNDQGDKNVIRNT